MRAQNQLQKNSGLKKGRRRGATNQRVIHRREQACMIAAFSPVSPGYILTTTIHGGIVYWYPPFPLSRHAACTNYYVTIIVHITAFYTWSLTKCCDNKLQLAGEKKHRTPICVANNLFLYSVDGFYSLFWSTWLIDLSCQLRQNVNLLIEQNWGLCLVPFI